ncbi:MAG: CBS domain-containing protein [Thermoproteota archaeon]|nr:CBS domain-containing protein [Thermoproteota archaeon]
MIVEDFMTKDVVTVDVNATVKTAVNVMNHYEIGCLIVVKDGGAVGILTERDLLKRILSKSRLPEDALVSEVMSKPLVVVSPHMELEEATRIMLRRNIKKLPVVKDDRLVGIVTLTDITRTARVEPQVMKIVKELSNSGWLPSKHMKRVIDCYIS